MNGEPILALDAVEAGYGEVQVLWGVSLAVPKGGLVTVIGANGAGKTTALRCAAGAIGCRAGSVRLAGDDVTRLSAHARAQRGLVLVPEGRQLFPDMTVRENLEMGAFAPRARPRARASLERVLALFPRLAERLDQRASTFSGGEQQMLALGRGLMAEPEILMIDELSLGLSPLIAQQLFGTLKSLRAEGLTILLVEQNVHLGLAVSDYAYVLAEGRIFAEGKAAELAAKQDIRAAYLGL